MRIVNAEMVNELLHKIGLHVNREPHKDGDRRRTALLRALSVDLVVDVGANVGQYASTLRRCGYSGHIISLEPMTAAYRELEQRAAGDRRWMPIHRAAGTKTGSVDLNVAGNSISSSLLPMLPLHKTAAPASAYVTQETIQVARLEDIVSEQLARHERPYLKVDTQGYEQPVLDGAGDLRRYLAVELEMSLRPLYDGQVLFDDLLHYLMDAGFRPIGFDTGFWNKNTGETYQLDGMFLRDDIDLT